MAPPMTDSSLILGYLKLCSRGASAGREATNNSCTAYAEEPFSTDCIFIIVDIIFSLTQQPTDGGLAYSNKIRRYGTRSVMPACSP